MKLTKEKLIQLINEEYKRVISEGWSQSKGIKRRTETAGTNAGDSLIIFVGTPEQQSFEISYDDRDEYLHIMRGEEKIYIHPKASGAIGRWDGTTDGTNKVDLLGGYDGNGTGLVRVDSAG